MSNKAWRMNEEDKIAVGRYIIKTIMSDGEFPKTASEGKQVLETIIKEAGECKVANKGESKTEGEEDFFEGTVSGVLFLENDANGIMHIAVPPREAVKDKVKFIEDYEYEIPDAYKNSALGNSELTNKELYEFRIGDYTISHCG